MNIKNILAVAVISAIGTAAIAQPYVKLAGGYSMSTAGSNIGYKSSYASDGSLTSLKAVRGTAGGGIVGALGFGYGINEHVAIELAGIYTGGSKEYVNETKANSNGDYTKVTVKGSQIRVIPAVVISAGGSLSPYGRFGLVLPVGGKTKVMTDAKFSGTGYTGTLKETTEASGQFSVGFDGALGIGFKLSENLTLFGEAEVVTLGIAGKKDVITEHVKTVTSPLGTSTENLSDLTVSEKEIEYVDEITSTTNSGNTGSSPVKELRDRTNYSTFGINIGVKFGF